MVLSSAVEQYIQQTISHSLGLAVPPGFLVEKLSQVEESKRSVEAHVLTLQHRLLDLEHRLAKSKEEASMNALALRRHVSENQNLEGQLKQVSQRCAWLEEECSLYFNDREVFMGVAEEAEDRAFKAEERCAEAERKVAQLLIEIDNLKKIQMEHTHWKEEINRLGCKVLQLETVNSNLQVELSNAEQQMAEARISQDSGLQSSMAATSFTCAASHCFDNGEDQSSLNKMKTEQCVCKEREGTQQLMAEVRKLWKEVAVYKCNLARAEIQVRILDDDNKDLRSALRNRSSTSSPVSKKGKTSLSKLQLQSKSLSDYLGPENNARQPLTALESNLLNLR